VISEFDGHKDLHSPQECSFVENQAGNKAFGSVAVKVKASLLRKPWSWAHDLGSPPSLTLIALLRPWIRCLAMITIIRILAWWLRTNNKLTGKKSKKHPENLEIGNS